MTDPLLIDDLTYIPINHASAVSHLSTEYLARLARSGRVRARRHAVPRNALFQQFLSTRSDYHERRRAILPNMPAKKPSEIAQLADMIERGFAAADKKFAALAEDIAEIKSSMATKDNIADLKTEMMDQFEHVDRQFHANDDRIRNISSEIALIHRHIERLEEQGASNAGFAKEIDLLMARVAEIEKHLGLDKNLAA